MRPQSVKVVASHYGTSRALVVETTQEAAGKRPGLWYFNHMESNA